MFNRMLGKYSFEKLIPSKEDQREAYTKEVALFTGKAFDLKSEVSEEISAQNSFIDSDSVPTNNAQVKKDMD